jgi:hypothetical protein
MASSSLVEAALQPQPAEQEDVPMKGKHFDMYFLRGESSGSDDGVIPIGIIFQESSNVYEVEYSPFSLSTPERMLELTS